jgi:hypothetical protein
MARFGFQIGTSLSFAVYRNRTVGDTMLRHYSILSMLILTALLIGCAPKAAVQPKELENPTPTALPEPSPTAETTQAEVVPQDPPASCPVTRPPEVAFVPPAPYPPEPPERYINEFWYGTPELWTMLGTEGTWYALPYNKNGYPQKIFWWSQNFDVSIDPYPAFRLSIERLDEDMLSSPVVVSEDATNASADFGTAMLTGVGIPELGCWKITGRYKESELSFVVWVAP